MRDKRESEYREKKSGLGFPARSVLRRGPYRCSRIVLDSQRDQRGPRRTMAVEAFDLQHQQHKWRAAQRKQKQSEMSTSDRAPESAKQSAGRGVGGCSCRVALDEPMQSPLASARGSS